MDIGRRASWVKLALTSAHCLITGAKFNPFTVFSLDFQIATFLVLWTNLRAILFEYYKCFRCLVSACRPAANCSVCPNLATGTEGKQLYRDLARCLLKLPRRIYSAFWQWPLTTDKPVCIVLWPVRDIWSTRGWGVYMNDLLLFRLTQQSPYSFINILWPSNLPFLATCL